MSTSIWNTRPWSTPLTMGAGTFVVATGLTMFFVAENPFKFAHELAGLTFAVAILLHVLNHRRPFVNHLGQRRGLGIVLTAWLTGAGLITASAVLRVGEADAVVVERVDSAPIALLAPVVGASVDELIVRLAAAGFAVDDPQVSIRELADRLSVDTDDILLVVFE